MRYRQVSDRARYQRRHSAYYKYFSQGGWLNPAIRETVSATAGSNFRTDVCETRILRRALLQAGLARAIAGFKISPRPVRPADRAILSGAAGHHGVTILPARGELGLAAGLRSGTRPVPGFQGDRAGMAGPGLRQMDGSGVDHSHA